MLWWFIFNTLQEYCAPGLCPEIESAWSEVADRLENSGAVVTQVTMPYTQYSINTYSVLCACEVASNMARYDGIEFGMLASCSNDLETTHSSLLFLHNYGCPGNRCKFSYLVFAV